MVRVLIIVTIFFSVFSTPTYSCPEFDRLIHILLRENDQDFLNDFRKLGLNKQLKNASGEIIDFTDDTVKKLIENRRNVIKGYHKYHTPPEDLPAFKNAIEVKGKTPYQNGSGCCRKRWQDQDGAIYEWDRQHGRVEKYSRTGKIHRGEYDAITGEKIKDGSKKRRIKP